MINQIINSFDTEILKTLDKNQVFTNLKTIVSPEHLQIEQAFSTCAIRIIQQTKPNKFKPCKVDDVVFTITKFHIKKLLKYYSKNYGKAELQEKLDGLFGPILSGVDTIFLGSISKLALIRAEIEKNIDFRKIRTITILKNATCNIEIVGGFDISSNIILPLEDSGLIDTKLLYKTYDEQLQKIIENENSPELCKRCFERCETYLLSHPLESLISSVKKKVIPHKVVIKEVIPKTYIERILEQQEIIKEKFDLEHLKVAEVLRLVLVEQDGYLPRIELKNFVYKLCKPLGWQSTGSQYRRFIVRDPNYDRETKKFNINYGSAEEIYSWYLESNKSKPQTKTVRESRVKIDKDKQKKSKEYIKNLVKNQSIDVNNINTILKVLTDKVGYSMFELNEISKYLRLLEIEIKSLS